MRTSLLAAAGLAALLAGIHSYLGERLVLGPLLRRDVPPLLGSVVFMRRCLRFAWHVTSIAWLGFAALIVALTSAQGITGRTLAVIIAATFAATGLTVLVASRGRHGAWPAFLAIAGLVWFGYGP